MTLPDALAEFLPELPDPCLDYDDRDSGEPAFEYYTAAQMRAYARAAIQAMADDARRYCVVKRSMALNDAAIGALNPITNGE